MNTKVLEVTRKLEKYPYLLARVEAMLEVAENSSGKYELADDVEMKLIEEVNKLGAELIETWGTNQEAKKSLDIMSKNIHLATHSKKKFPSIPDLEK